MFERHQAANHSAQIGRCGDINDQVERPTRACIWSRSFDKTNLMRTETLGSSTALLTCR